MGERLSNPYVTRLGERRGTDALIRPGWPFWSGFTAFAANMLCLLGVDALSITEIDISVGNWSSAAVISLIVAAAVYGKEKQRTRPPAKPKRKAD